MVPGGYPLHKFYGVIGTRPSFGAGERYPAFNREWTTMGYETISVSYNTKITSLINLQISRKLFARGGTANSFLSFFSLPLLIFNICTRKRLFRPLRKSVFLFDMQFLKFGTSC